MSDGSIIVGVELKISLRVVADRTYVGSGGADHDMAAVAALPDAVSVS